MDKVIYVTCPSCHGEYYVERSDYDGKPDAPCYCPFCRHEFVIRDGSPRPPVVTQAQHFVDNLMQVELDVLELQFSRLDF